MFFIYRVKIIRLSTGEVSATDVKEKIKRKINEGFKPDLVIIDYFDCLAPEKGTGSLTKWEQEGKTMRKLENMAKDMDIAIWVPTQGNRESLAAELITADKMGGSMMKAHAAQVIISIARSLEDTKNQKATLAVIKNRSGMAGTVFNGIKFDNGTCTISCDEVIDFDSALSYDAYATAVKEQKEDEFKKEAMRAIMARKTENGEFPDDF